MTKEPLHLYRISKKKGDSLKYDVAYVEARNEKQAILRYCGNEKILQHDKLQDIKYTATTILKLPATYYYESTHVTRLPYIPDKELWHRNNPGHLEISFPTIDTSNILCREAYTDFIYDAIIRYCKGIIGKTTKPLSKADKQCLKERAEEMLAAVELNKESKRGPE
jgi:hypothetical protein